LDLLVKKLYALPGIEKVDRYEMEEKK